MKRITLTDKPLTLSWPKWVGVALTIISLTVACVLWASSEHSDIKEFTTNQDYVNTKDIKEYVNERYVPKESFSRIEENLKGQKEDIGEIKDKLDQIFEAVHSK